MTAGAIQNGRHAYAGGARAALPLIVPALAFGASFGVLARTAGMDALAAVLMSATTFAGSAQFAAVSILGTGGGIAAAVAAALVLNARYATIGLTVASEIPGGWWQRLVRAQLIVDESWALSRVGSRFDGRRLLGAGLVLYAAWVLGTLAGAVFGRYLADPRQLGLDAAFPALFLALVVAFVDDRASVRAALAGAAIAAALLPFTPPGVPVIAASAGAVVAWRMER